MDKRERLNYVLVIRQFVIECIVMLCQQSINLASKDLNTSVSNKLIEKRNYFLEETILEGDDLIPNSDYIIGLWNDFGIQKTFEYRSLYDIADEAQYFLDKVLIINKEDYIPSYEDCALWKTTRNGISTITFLTEMQGQQVPFEFISLKTRSSYRRKRWMNGIADGVKALLYMFSLNDFDKLNEALLLFTEIIEGKYFKDKLVIVLLDKYDLFCEKLKTTPITVAFDDFPNDDNPFDKEQVTQFIMEKFQSIYTNSGSNNSTLVIHRTDSIDSDLVDTIIYHVKLGLVRQFLDKRGLN